MSMFDNIKKKFAGKKKPVQEKPVQEKPPVEKKKSPKEIATEKGEPYVSILGLELDVENMHQGSFELDWNEIFVARLVKAGYMMKKEDTDAEIVDRWFQNVCRHVVMETWEQEEAMNPTRRVNVKDLGNGRKEVS
jgi:hypothetical protein